MLNKPTGCAGCPLEHSGQGFMATEGNGALGVMAIAEALGEQEMIDGLPLRPQAPAGSIFERSLRLANIPRQSLAITNICKCKPPKNLLENQWYEVDAVNHCRRYMDSEVEKFNPKVMLAMGNIPLKYLTGYAGAKRTITNVRGFYLDGTRYPIPVVSTYHPSYIQRDKPNLLGVYRIDILRAIALAKAGGRFCRPTKKYTIFPSIVVAQRFLSDCQLNSHLPICYDIETEESIGGVDESELKATNYGGLVITKTLEEYMDSPEHLLPEDDWEREQISREEVVPRTRITQIQFSLRPDMSAIVLPWEGDYIPIIKAILATVNDKWHFNGRLFDNPILGNHGAVVVGDQVDFMDAFHFLQPDLPKGLQYVTSFYMPEAEPWKHTSGSDPGQYGGDDVAYLRKYGERLLGDLETRGLGKGFGRHVVRLGVQLDRASIRGMPVDNVRRGELGLEMDVAKAEVDGRLQGIYPDEIKLIEPREGYKNDGIAEKRKLQVGGGLEKGERWTQRSFKGVGKTSSDTTEDCAAGECKVSLDEVSRESIKRWCRLQPFLPNSPKQILAYIKYKYDEEVKDRMTRESRPQSRDVAERNAIYYIPKEFKTGKETTAKKELERLGVKTGDKLFPWVIEHREYGKMKSTYVDGWAPNGDGCVHTKFTFGPATGQLSSKGPNIQNGPKHGRLAKKFRAMVRAKPGHVLIEVDKTAFHALTLGFEARDPLYMRLARLDIHSFVAANLLWLHSKPRFRELGLPPNPERWTELADEELKGVLAKVKKGEEKLRNKKAKPSILGIGFGLGAKKLYEMNIESFENVAEAKKIQGIIKGLFPKVFDFQAAVRAVAHGGLKELGKQRDKGTVRGVYPGLVSGINGGYLLSRHGYMRWFFDVFHWDSKSQQVKPGKDSEAAIAFLPANDAFGMIKEEMLRLAGGTDWNGDTGIGWTGEDLLEKYGFINQIHDSLMFHCRKELVEEALDYINRAMTRPSKVLIDPIVAPGGLVCGVEAMIGDDWSSMEVVN